jgi:hypothetical protein
MAADVALERHHIEVRTEDGNVILQLKSDEETQVEIAMQPEQALHVAVLLQRAALQAKTEQCERTIDACRELYVKVLQ